MRILAAVLGLLCLSAGCRSPADRFLDVAAARGLEARDTDGAGFRHLVLAPGRARGRTLHVYLDGDGVPWLGGHPTADPTPRDPLVLDLMTRDRAAAVYLGRPCYHGHAADPGCSPALWTSARYSEAVVTSMAAAARRLLAARGAERIVWLGYSGGGALAMLLATRVPETVGVVTVAANLDIDAWADQQGFSRLGASLNPARQPPLPAHIYQRHYAGARDRTVPPEAGARGVSVVAVPGYDHRCCWATMWPTILADLERGLTTLE